MRPSMPGRWWGAPAGSALPMFEELELWDPLIVCYQMLGKAPQVAAAAQACITFHCTPFPTPAGSTAGDCAKTTAFGVSRLS